MRRRWIVVRKSHLGIATVAWCWTFWGAHRVRDRRERHDREDAARFYAKNGWEWPKIEFYVTGNPDHHKTWR